MMRTIIDGLVNVVANLGTARDKAAHSAYVYSALSYDQLIASYRSAWLPRAIVDIPAKEATRKWRLWRATSEQITAIEKVEKRLRVRNVALQGLIAARLFGGAAIYIGTKDRDPSEPLDPAAIGEIRSLTVLTPLQLNPGQISRDIDGDYYGKPEFYELSGEGKAPISIHASRLVVFEGAPVPDVTRRTSGWGDSVLQSTMDAVTQADSACANISSLIFEAKVDVFRFDGFADQLARGADDALTRRLTAQAAMKGINGAVVIDKADEYDQKSASFSSLPDLMDRFMNNVSGAARIPVTRLFGRASVGLSGTGDGDERVYFDHIQHLQSSEIGPALSVLDECIIWEALGSRPEEIFYEWSPLRQATEKERAEIFNTTAQAARALAGANAGELVPVEALSDALINELTEQGMLPGLGAKVAEYGTLYEQETETAREAVAAAVESERRITLSADDAAPRTLYVRRDVLNGDEIIAWAKGQGFETTLPAGDLHVTIAFSKQPVDWMKVGEAWESKLELPEGGPRLMEQFGEAKVLLFRARDLEWRHEAIRAAGASWDHPDYQPHITISYGPLPEGIEPYQGRIILGPERFEEVRGDWQESIREE